MYPTMITPFKKDLTIDYDALESLVEWYIDNGVDGLFAVCQSSAMFELSLKERVALARAVVQITDCRVPVVASGSGLAIATKQGKAGFER